MRKLITGLLALIDPDNRERDVKLLAFGAVVVAAIVWLSLDQRKTGITPAWVDAFAWLCALVGIGGAGWAAVEKWRGGKGAGQQTKAPGTPGEGGQP